MEPPSSQWPVIHPLPTPTTILFHSCHPLCFVASTPPFTNSMTKTCRSSEHVVHQGTKAPPVYSPVVATANQYLWGPVMARRRTGEREKTIDPQVPFTQLQLRQSFHAGCVDFPKILSHIHVFYGATKGVGDSAVMDRLFAEPEVCQFNMPCRRDQKNEILF